MWQHSKIRQTWIGFIRVMNYLFTNIINLKIYWIVNPNCIMNHSKQYQIKYLFKNRKYKVIRWFLLQIPSSARIRQYNPNKEYLSLNSKKPLLSKSNPQRKPLTKSFNLLKTIIKKISHMNLTFKNQRNSVKMPNSS